MILRSFLLIFFSFSFLVGFSQEKTITIKGKVVDPKSSDSFYNVLVVNKRTQTGKLGNPDGSFEITAHKNDIILVGSTGYHTVPISMEDSVAKDVYTITIRLYPLQFKLREVEIFSERELKAIHEDIQTLGYEKKDYVVSGINAVESPITFLYQSYSRRERQIRKAIELENEQKRRDLLKELFKIYVSAEIIDLKDEDFDTFIDFCQISDYQMKVLTQYEFIMYIKKKYELWEPYIRPKDNVPNYRQYKRP